MEKLLLLNGFKEVSSNVNRISKSSLKKSIDIIKIDN